MNRNVYESVSQLIHEAVFNRLENFRLFYFIFCYVLTWPLTIIISLIFWCECVKSDMKIKGLRAEWARDREMWRGLLSGKRTPVQAWIYGRKNGDDDGDDDSIV